MQTEQFNANYTRKIAQVVTAISLCVMLRQVVAAADVIEDWFAFDQLIETSVMERPEVIIPPSASQVGYTLGLRRFAPQEFPELAALPPAKYVGEVPLWQVRVLETNDCFFTVAGDTVIHSNAVAPYDAIAWAYVKYGPPSVWVTADSARLAEWHFLRRRERVVMYVSLVSASQWDDYMTALAVARASTLPPDRKLPTMPTDTNRVAFARVASSASGFFSFDLYTPDDLPVDIFTKTNLAAASRWSYAGTVQAVAPFTPASVAGRHQRLFLHAAHGDIDSDGDGIPDGMELLHFGTNPLLWDSSGDGLSDWRKIYQYGLDPLSRDSDGDGYSDDEELLAGTDPTQITPGATAGALRYFRDLDDRVTAIYVGTDGAATTATVTPAGNPTTLQERSTP